MPYCREWDEAKEIPASLLKKAYDAQVLPALVGYWPAEYVGAGPEGFDYFHEYIAID